MGWSPILAQFDDQYRRAAGYVDRILKGEKASKTCRCRRRPSTSSVINLKTAKALAYLALLSLLARAYEVIEVDPDVRYWRQAAAFSRWLSNLETAVGCQTSPLTART